MRISPTITVLLLSCPFAACVLTFPIAKRDTSGATLPSRSLWKRQISEPLFNNISLYQANVSIGTPPQQFSLMIDTGSSDIILVDINAVNQCADLAIQSGGCFGGFFDPTKSSTFQSISNETFKIQYGGGTVSSGDYMTDDFSIGGATVKNLQMGLANTTTSGFGVIGIGFDENEASLTSITSVPYPNLIDQMVSQGLINTKAYSLYLDDLEESTGSIVFGGVDTNKFIGPLKIVPIQPVQDIYAEFLITVTDISFTDQSGTSSSLATIANFSEPFLLDSGSTFLYLPGDMVNSLTTKLSAVTYEENYFVDCNFRFSKSNAFLSFTFGGAGAPTINVPLSELIYSTEGPSYGFPFSSVCELGISTVGPTLIFGESNPYILGDTFLRSAYVVYDLTHNEIGLGQTNFGSTTSNIVELKAADSGIPALTGVASGVTQISSDQFTSAAPTAAATSSGGTSPTTGLGGTSTTSEFATFTNSVPTGLATTSAPGAKNEAVGAVPAFGTAAVAVLAVSGLFAALGGLVIVL